MLQAVNRLRVECSEGETHRFVKASVDIHCLFTREVEAPETNQGVGFGIITVLLYGTHSTSLPSLLTGS